MSECMPIPDNWKDFVKEYSFKDIREVYTNGSRLIPTFRVEQMMEHYCHDWISVKDRLPDEYEDVLVFRVYNRRTMMSVDTYDTDRKRFSKYHNGGITHWMPLPVPPKEDDTVVDQDRG